MFCRSLVNADVVLPILRAWKKEGPVKHVGASHHENAYHPLLADLVERGQVDFVQVNDSIFNRGGEDRQPGAAADNCAQFFIKWAMDNPAVTTVLTGTSKPEHAAQNVATLRGPLPDAAMRQRMEGIAGFGQLASMPWYPDKQAQYPGVIRRAQGALRVRL